MSHKQIDKLIINSPYEEPKQYWQYVRETREFVLESGRRPAGYIIATPQAKGFDDPGVFVRIELVNTIRPRIKDWRDRGYPGVTGITKRLLTHWQDPEERKDRRFFFCQLEAIETMIWLAEAPDAEKTGIAVPSDGGDFIRWCCKMATGSGKTIVMAMAIAWHILNKVIYMDKEVKDDITRKADAADPLPDLITNAYYLLGKDWLETKKRWSEQGHTIPPVMITVANLIETSSRIKYAFDHEQISIKELCDSDKTLQIDSKVLDQAEAATESETVLEGEKKLTKKQQAELLRQQVDTVGKPGKPGAHIQNVISVGMLSEGWDASTVTHIMGLRAFSSQLLCEQVVGRGLRRTTYTVEDDGLFAPEYVNIFGVPFTFLPHEGGDGPPPPPPPPKTIIEPVPEKGEHELSWPNILRVDHIYQPRLAVNMDDVIPLELDPYDSITEAGLAAIIAGKPNPAALSEIDLKEIGERIRLQTLIFETAKRIFNYEKPNWQGPPELFLVQLIRIVEGFIASDKIRIKNDLFRRGELHKRILIMLNLNKIIQHIWNAIRMENTRKLVPVFDTENPIRSTGNMRTWHTSKPCEWTQKSHINFCVFDSTWEASETYTLDRHSNVKSWVKNDHIGFIVLYNFQGVVRKYYPDFIIRLVNGDHLILETKGQDTQQNKTKRAFLDEWVKAVNNQGGFGKWKWAVSFHPSDLENILNDFIA